MTVTDTSREAYATTLLQRETQAARVYKVITRFGRFGVTDPEIVELTGIRLSSVNGARNALMDDGLVVDSGKRMRNPDTGKLNILWRVV